jgi:hypothetical protein
MPAQDAELFYYNWLQEIVRIEAQRTSNQVVAQ